MSANEIVEMIESDIRNLPSINPKELSAFEYYGALLSVPLKFLLGLILVKGIVSMSFLSVGLCSSKFAYHFFLTLSAFDLMMALFSTIGASKFVLFSKMFRGKLQSFDFIKEKFKYIVIFYYIVFAIIFSTTFLYERNVSLGWVFLVPVSSFFAYIITFIFLSLETSRIVAAPLYKGIFKLIEQCKVF